MSRKTIGKKVRFEVFKRDKFTCQYCGGKAPEVLLHVDHIQPVADGGTDDILNLVTSCSGCNLGKGARRLDDSSSIEKQRAQLEELQERRDQLEMMVEWQRGLVNLERASADIVGDFWTSLGSGFGLNDYGRDEIQKWLKKYPAEQVMEAMREAASEKFRTTVDGTTDFSSVSDAFHLVPKLLRIRKESEREPFLRDAYYIRGILRRRFDYKVKEQEAKELILESLNLGSTVEEEKAWAIKAPSYWQWQCEMYRHLRELREEDEE